jgi:hypothetical protein
LLSEHDPLTPACPGSNLERSRPIEASTFLLSSCAIGVSRIDRSRLLCIALVWKRLALVWKRLALVSDPSIKPMDLFIDRKIDAFLAGPPRPQDVSSHSYSAIAVQKTDASIYASKSARGGFCSIELSVPMLLRVGCCHCFPPL